MLTLTNPAPAPFLARPTGPAHNLAALGTLATAALVWAGEAVVAHYDTFRNTPTRDEQRVLDARQALTEAQAGRSEAALCRAACTAFDLVERLCRTVNRDLEANAAAARIQDTGWCYRQATR